MRIFHAHKPANNTGMEFCKVGEKHYYLAQIIVSEYILFNLLYLHQNNPVALAHLGERQTEVQSLNLEVLCSIHRSDISFGARFILGLVEIFAFFTLS